MCVCVGEGCRSWSSSLAFIRDRGGGEEEQGGLRAGGGQLSQLRVSLAEGITDKFLKITHVCSGTVRLICNISIGLSI